MDFFNSYNPPSSFDFGNDSLLLGGGLPSEAPSFSIPDTFSMGSTAPSGLSLGFLTPTAPTIPTPTDEGRSWYDSLTSPNVLGAAITAGAGLFGGLAAQDQRKSEMKAAQEQQKMNNLLELAKLKYQLTKGSSGGGRGGSGARQPTRAEIEAAQSNNLAGSYNNVGTGIAGVY